MRSASILGEGVGWRSSPKPSHPRMNRGGRRVSVLEGLGCGARARPSRGMGEGVVGKRVSRYSGVHPDCQLGLPIRLRGSSDLHAIGDSNAYLARTSERLMLTLEHRAASPPDPMEIELLVDEDTGSAQLRVCDRAAAFASRARSLADSVVDLLEREARSMSRTELRAELQVNNARLGTALEQLSSDGQIGRTSEGWAMI